MNETFKPATIYQWILFFWKQDLAEEILVHQMACLPNLSDKYPWKIWK